MSGAQRRSLASALHFAVAAVVLGGSALGWSVAVHVLKIATHKEPVVWPNGVMVDDEFHMVSLPDKIGPYEYVDRDGEIHRDEAGRPVRDGKPDGQANVEAETMELLKIGTGTDKRNLPERKSNWLAIRTYRDSRVRPDQRLRYWRAEMYYYTGGVDLVPHVPEICGVAGGAILIGSDEISITLPGAPGAWGQRTIDFRRTRFEKTDLVGRKFRFAQYYVFSLNGRPECERYQVRWKLASPFIRRAYFAKIQFAPLGAVADQRKADEAAKEFARHFLPEALKVLPLSPDAAASGADVADGQEQTHSSR